LLYLRNVPLDGLVPARLTLSIGGIGSGGLFLK
jgi:hypothetical protein